MPSYSLFTLIRRFTKMSLLIAALLFSASMLNAQEAVYFKCRWTGDYIYCVAKNPSQNPTSTAFVNLSLAKTLWFIERVDDTWVRLRTKDSLYLNVEKGKLDAGKVPAAFLSSHWKLPVTDGHNLIINRWTGVYINFEHHDLEASAASPGLYSAQWSMEDKNGIPLAAKDFSMNAYTSLLPNQQVYYKLENLKYDPTPVYLDINRTRSSELATVADYGGDNSGKAWKFTQVSDGWYKISNLKLGGSKVLAIAKNTDGKYYFVLTDFANYPNQLWKMIQFKDQSLLKYVTEKKLGAEKFNSQYYILVSKQHGLEAIKTVANIDDNPRLFSYGLNAGIYAENPFDLFWHVNPIADIATVKNVPLSIKEQTDLANAAVAKSIREANAAILKATPIAESPFKKPVGRIKGDLLFAGNNTGGRDLGRLTGNNEQEYTEGQWIALNEIAGKIPMFVYNNTNFDVSISISYTDESGQQISRKYIPTAPGKRNEFYLDPLCTYIVFTATHPASGTQVYRTNQFYRPKGVKIYLDGNIKDTRSSVWNW